MSASAIHSQLKATDNFRTEEAVLKVVASTPVAIGYLDAARLRGNVRMALKL
jgi:hypothetical protein